MTAIALLQHLRGLGVLLTLSPDGTLHYKASCLALDPEMRAAMQAHRTALIELLQSESSTPTPAPWKPSPWVGPGFGGPCALCGIDDRWQDKYGMLRCRACWPPPPETERS